MLLSDITIRPHIMFIIDVVAKDWDILQELIRGYEHATVMVRNREYAVGDCQRLPTYNRICLKIAYMLQEIF